MSSRVVSAEILTAVAARISTINPASAYPDPFKTVFWNKIPMGLELSPEALPVAFVMNDNGAYNHQFKVMDVGRAVRIQVVHREDASDTEMATLVNNVARAIYANHPTAEIETAFRGIHPSITWVELDQDDTDLNMIEANRFAALRLIVHYRCKPYEI